MLTIYRSLDPHALVTALADSIRRQRGGDSLARVDVAIPNLMVDRWLRFALADRLGVVAGIEFGFLETGLKSRLSDLDSVVSVDDVRLGLIRAFADDELMASPSLSAPRRYLQGESGNEERERRAFQLADELAALFEEYGLQDPELLIAWRRERRRDPDAEGTEAWQAALFRAVLGSDGVLARRGVESGPPRFLSELFAATEGPAPSRPGAPWHLFGVGHLGKSYRQALSTLGQTHDINAYFVLPEASEGDGSASFLSEWSRLVHECAYDLEISGSTEARFVLPDPRPSTQRLGSLRQLTTHDTDDESLRIFAAPDPVREVEAVVDDLLEQIRASGESTGLPLRYSDCAILLPPHDTVAYAERVAAALYERGHFPISRPRPTSRLVEAAERLFALPLRPFDRKELLALFREPAFQRRFPDADVDRWETWVEDLDITHGLDAADHADTYLDVERFHWDQGLRRLALGAFMRSEEAGLPRPYAAGESRWLPREIRGNDLASAGCLARVVRSLGAMARRFQSRRLSPAAWSRELRAVLASFLAPDGDEEGGSWPRLLEAVGTLELLDRAAGEEVFGYRTMHELLRGKLESLRRAGGGDLMQGIVVAPFASVRPRPFRYTAILGLGEGRFPAAESRSGLDLLSGPFGRRESSARERDLAAFADALLSTGEFLRLSYLACDPVSGDPREPSRVIREIQAWCRSEEATTTVPLDALATGPSPKAEAVSPTREAERRGVKLRSSLTEQLASGTSMPRIQSLRDRLKPAKKLQLESTLGLQSGEPQETAEDEGIERLDLPLAMLAEFLIDPLQASARRLVGLETDEETSVSEIVDEAFEVDAMHRSVVLRESLETWLLNPKADRDLGRSYAESVDRAILTGRWPHGLFDRAAREDHEALLQTFENQVTKLDEGDLFPLRRHRFGRGDENTEGEAPWPPIELTIRPGEDRTIRLRLHGTCAPFCSSKMAVMRMTPVANSAPATFRSFIDLLALSAGGVEDFSKINHEGFAYTLLGGRVSPHVAVIQGLEQDRSLDRLAELSQQFLFATHEHYLPGTVILKSLDAPEELAEKLRLEQNQKEARNFGPIRDVETYPLPTQPMLDAILKTRFQGLSKPAVRRGR